MFPSVCRFSRQFLSSPQRYVSFTTFFVMRKANPSTYIQKRFVSKCTSHTLFSHTLPLSRACGYRIELDFVIILYNISLVYACVCVR